ncbi:MAG: HEAT repeat domain-containing protein [Coriobacteriia bacterium]|nr:HEAT repeat domain-containing protein [Coriobacteriia bacterium]
MDAEGFPRAEEALRLLANAVAAARLYPPASAIPREAAENLVERARTLTAAGPLRYHLDPDGFRVGETPIAAGQSQVMALAESLYALQAGQLVMAPGVTLDEVLVFVDLTNRDATRVRSAGGLRAQLGASGVAHIAIIEVSLRASEDGGLLGLDLTSAPLDEIAAGIADAAERRAQMAAQGAASDELAEAVDRLEDAMREIALERVAAAMMRLDEQTRMRVLGLSLKADTSGERMEGMLAAVARMKPASLARLLTLVASQADTDPRRIATALTLPPEATKMLMMMLEPRPNLDPDFGVPAQEQAQSLADEMDRDDTEDQAEVARQVAIASPALASGRALATATAVSRSHADPGTIRAIGEVLPRAARDGAFSTVRETLRRLDEIATEPSLADEVTVARATLADPKVLTEVCRAPVTDADAAIAGEILQAAGPPGAEALLDVYVRLSEPKRSLLRPVMRSMSEGVLGVARQRLRTADPAMAVAIIRTLPQLGDRRAVPVVAAGLTSLDEQVRFASASALASMPVPEAEAALIRAINHREPETQRQVVREVARAHIEGAVPALSRALEDINVFQRTYETRKEIIAALEEIGTPEAEKALRRFAQRTLGLGRKSRELRVRAVRVADELSRSRGVSQQ